MESNPENGRTQPVTKVDRKVMEKNRRNQMNILYSKLNSLLPNQHSQELPPTVSDQIDEAINYIKSLESKLKRLERKILLGVLASIEPGVGRNSPQLKVREMGSAVEAVLTSGLDDQSIFYEVIHIFHEERAEIISASYFVNGRTVFYTLHAEIEDVVYESGATKLTERLKRLVYGSTSDAEMQAAALCDNHGGIHPETWPAL